MSSSTVETLPSSHDIAAAYDSLTPIVEKYWGVDLHYGYWSGPGDDTPSQRATDRLTSIVVDKLGVQPESRVLDIGCGHGRPAVAVGRVTGAQVVGVDINERALAAAAAYASAEGLADQVVFECYDALTLPYAESSFDAVLAFESTPHFELVPLFREIARVVRPGGRVVVETPFLRAPITDEFRSRAADFFDILQITSINTFDTHLQVIRDAGFQLDEFVDITDQVNTTFVRFAKQLLQHRTDLVTEYCEEIAEQTIRTFSEWATISQAEVGGMIMTVRRLG